jgi:hypothetical protein
MSNNLFINYYLKTSTLEVETFEFLGLTFEFLVHTANKKFII